MYRCQLCGDVVPPRTPCHHLVIRTRRRRYPARAEANRVVRLVNGKVKETYTDDPGGVGSETAVEVRACPACAARRANPTGREPNAAERSVIA